MEKEGTKIMEKHYSPLIIRRYNFFGTPVFVALITDDDLNDLDNFVISLLKEVKSTQKIQEARNICGMLTEKLREHYAKAEGIAVVAYFDKLMVSSLWGDFMHHVACRIELYNLLLMMTQL